MQVKRMGRLKDWRKTPAQTASMRETRCRRRVEPPRAIPVGRTDAKLLFIGITLTTRTHTA